MQALDYRREERAPDAARLVEDDAGCTLTFRMTPVWTVWVGVGATLATLVANMGLMAYLAWSLSGWRIPTPERSWFGLLLFVSATLFCAMVGISSWRNVRLYGHLPETWVIDRARRVLRHRPERTWRWREWPLTRVTRADVRPIRALSRAGAVRMSVKIEGRYLPLATVARTDERTAVEGFIRSLNKFPPC